MGWNDVKPTNNNTNGERKLNYLKLNQGTNQIRILDDEPVSTWQHWIPQANYGKGISVVCPGKDCPICKERKKTAEAMKTDKSITQKYNVSRQHMINVIDRATGEVAILQKGNTIFENLVVFLEEIGDLREYDVRIIRKGTGRQTTYTVIPVQPSTPLTEKEKNLEKFDLEKLAKPLEIDQILQLMEGKSYDDIFNNNDDSSDDEPDVDFTTAS